MANLGRLISSIALPIAVVCWLVRLALRLFGSENPPTGPLELTAGLALALCIYVGILGAVLCGLALMRNSDQKRAIVGLLLSLFTFALGLASVLFV